MTSDGYKGPTEPVTTQSPRRGRAGGRSKHRRQDIGSRGAGHPAKHAARALARHIAAGSLDGRTWIARTLTELRGQLARDRGCFRQTDDAAEALKCHDGTCAHLSAAERMLLDRCAAATLICSTIEGHVFGRTDRLVDDAGELLPILRKGYVTHVQSLSRMLQALGLRDRAEATPDLSTYLAARAQPAPPVASTAALPADAEEPLDAGRRPFVRRAVEDDAETAPESTQPPRDTL